MREILIQEEFLDDHWKMMVCCILLNQTSNKQVRPILRSVFELIPDPISAIRCDHLILAAVIKTTGFQNLKASRIIRMSEKWISGFDDPIELPGIGQYGRDTWKIFVERKKDFQPGDKKLSAYLKSLESEFSR